ncbi:MAG: hypothetical protein ACFFDN_19390 [Candidatus Hodarchaeota archaeon]
MDRQENFTRGNNGMSLGPVYANYLEDFLDAIAKVARFNAGMSFDQFSSKEYF